MNIMRLNKLIKDEEGVSIVPEFIDITYLLKRKLRLAREQGVLSEICTKLGISLRSAQRWLPTPRVVKRIKTKPEILVRIKGKKKTSAPEYYKPLFSESLPPTEYEVVKRKRKNKKKKSLNMNKSIERLLQIVITGNQPIPNKEPTNKEIMCLLLKLKKSAGTWKKVSEELDVAEMVLYRFRKTGEMKKCNRILFYLLLKERKS